MRGCRREAEPPARPEEGPVAGVDGAQRDRRHRLLEHRLQAGAGGQVAVRADGAGAPGSAHLLPAAVFHSGGQPHPRLHGDVPGARALDHPRAHNRRPRQRRDRQGVRQWKPGRRHPGAHHPRRMQRPRLLRQLHARHRLLQPLRR